ncbi:hypothetical protein PP653_gp071 [Bacillus phage Basilisk]|uniref:Uncharacterized protein n=1 Tax=Bacillus phage Basilisk TaxID=1296654 RepID=S5M867_9CAUD|nr:hypothetical protein PP653_gp071 [Bacillus phage Basilisk]AGR46638.1 hypothetical protein BASILISK_96 [Bacillus phage Basilisk]
MLTCPKYACNIISVDNNKTLSNTHSRGNLIMNKQKFTDALTALETSSQLHKDAVNFSQRAIESAQSAVKLFKEAAEEFTFESTEDKIFTFDANKSSVWIDDKGLNVATFDTYRKYVVDLAKEEINDLENRSVKINQGHKSGDIIDRGFDPLRGNWTRARFNEVFHVNKEKRTVVCLLVGYKTGHVYSRGIAKCDPNDTFNEHLGKIIAYYRAANEEVPEIFLTVPNPEKIKNGDIIKHPKDAHEWEVDHIVTVDDYIHADYNWQPLDYKNHALLKEVFNEFKVIDDSNRK